MTKSNGGDDIAESSANTRYVLTLGCDCVHAEWENSKKARGMICISLCIVAAVV